MRACHGVGVVVVSVCGRRERALSSTSLFQWLAADGLFPPPPICLHRLRLLRRPSPGFGECRRTLFLFYAGNESRTSSLPLMSFHHRFSMRHTVNIGNREINVSGHVGKRPGAREQFSRGGGAPLENYLPQIQISPRISATLV